MKVLITHLRADGAVELTHSMDVGPRDTAKIIYVEPDGRKLIVKISDRPALYTEGQ